VVTGCTDGIGKGIALELAERGFNLVLISRSMDKLNATAKEAQDLGRKNSETGIDTRVIVFDFSSDTSIAAYQSLAKKMEGLDISVLVNNVGVGAPNDDSPEAAYKVISANCYPIVLLTQQLIPKLEERFKKNGKRSSIINFSS